MYSALEIVEMIICVLAKFSSVKSKCHHRERNLILYGLKNSDLKTNMNQNDMEDPGKVKNNIWMFYSGEAPDT